MNYKLTQTGISILDKKDFNPQHILECGQIFAYKKDGDDYIVFSRDKSARITENDMGYEIITKDPLYFENFFDLKTDYSEIKNKLSHFKILKKPIEFGYGIRILKNDLFEMLVSFIISANNNISRIKKIITALKMEFSSSAFPTHAQLLSLSEADFKRLGLGYRAAHLYKALRQVDEATLKSWQKLETSQVQKNLIALSGVGPKVADCVLLFGYSRKDVFPVDTWIHQMYNTYYPPLEDRIKIRAKLIDEFGDLAGYAQQYLFYYQRSGF